MLHVCALSKTDRSQVVSRSRIRRSISQGSIDPGPHSGAGPGRVSRLQSDNEPQLCFCTCCLCWCSPTEVSSNQIALMTGHDGTDREDDLLGDTPLLCKDVTDMQAQHSEPFLTVRCSSFEGGTSHDT